MGPAVAVESTKHVDGRVLYVRTDPSCGRCRDQEQRRSCGAREQFVLNSELSSSRRTILGLIFACTLRAAPCSTVLVRSPHACVVAVAVRRQMLWLFLVAAGAERET